jgi:CRP-like cAMP-binding protein
MPKIKTLKQSTIFSTLSDRELALFSRIVSEEEFIQDTVLVAENMKSDKFYLIEKGGVAIVSGKLEGGQGLILGEGDSFGEWSLLAPPHLTSIAAKVTEPARILILEKDDLDRFAEEEPAIALKILLGIIRSLWSSIREVERMLKESL